MKKRTIAILTISLVAVLIAGATFFIIEEEDGNNYTVKKGTINSIIDCVGEVQGGSARTIMMPPVLRDWDMRIYSYKIVDLIEEGKTVSKGDYVAKLDDSGLNNNMRNKLRDKEKVDADLRNAELDSTVRLTNIREQITNLELDLEYVKIDLDQSKYQSVAEQRKVKMKYQKAQIALDKKRRDYILEQNKLKIQISRFENRATNLIEEIQKLQNAIRATKIVSPSDGMLMYGKDYSGKKYSKDSEVQIFREDPIAILPDMSTVVSDAFVKEIDVTKLNLNDSVSITIDALPEKEFSGKLVKIANIGEDHKNYDMRVFKVKVQLDGADSELKPGMTCTNSIIIDHASDCLVVPQEAIFVENDKKFVYKGAGGRINKQYIKVGAEDYENAEILEGLNEGDKVLLDQPEDMEEIANL